MPNAVFFNFYRLKKGSFVPDFLVAVDNLINEYVSKQKGFISCKLLVNGESWADFAIFETMEDIKSFINPGSTNDFSEKFYSFLDFDTCCSHIFSVERRKERISDIPNAVTFVSFKLKNGACVRDFLHTSDKVDNRERENIDEISRMLLADGNLWADLVYWKSMEGPKKAAEYEYSYPVFKEYFSFIGEVTFHSHFTVEKSY